MENEESNDFPICLMEQLGVVGFQWDCVRTPLNWIKMPSSSCSQWLLWNPSQAAHMSRQGHSDVGITRSILSIFLIGSLTCMRYWHLIQHVLAYIYIYTHNITWVLHAGPCSAYFLVSPLLNACSILQEETIRLLSWNILAPSYCNGLYFKESCAHPTIGWLFVPGFNVLPGALNGFNHYKWCTMVDIWWLMV